MTIFRDTHLVEKSVQRGFMSGTQIIEISEAVRAKVLGVSAVALFFFFLSSESCGNFSLGGNPQLGVKTKS